MQNNFDKNHYSEQLCKSLERKAGGWHNAEDVVQEAYFRSLKHFKSFTTTKGSFDLWFPAILNNCLRAHLRAENLKGACIVNSEDEMEQPREGLQELSVLTSQIYEAIKNNDNPDARACLVLYYFEGLPSSDIAKITSLTKVNIRQIVHRFKLEVGGML